MTRTFLLLAFCLCYAPLLSAQSDFRPGFIIQNDNDSIYGLIDYKGDKTNARQCRFLALERWDFNLGIGF